MAGNFAAEILQQRFAFKRIGISVTQEQQQMPMFMYPYTGKTGMPGHGVVITTLIFREGLIPELFWVGRLIWENTTVYSILYGLWAQRWQLPEWMFWHVSQQSLTCPNNVWICHLAVREQTICKFKAVSKFTFQVWDLQRDILVFTNQSAKTDSELQ